jgi:hypothetical protein
VSYRLVTSIICRRFVCPRHYPVTSASIRRKGVSNRNRELRGKGVRSLELENVNSRPASNSALQFMRLNVLASREKLLHKNPHALAEGNFEGEFMKSSLLICLGLLIWGLGIGFAQDSDFQTGKVVAVEKVASSSTTGGSDAPVAPNKQKYNLSIQLNDMVYLCRGATPQDMDLDWAKGKEVSAKVKGKTLSVRRANGTVVTLSVLSTKKAE